eukprot:gene9096-11147_t
MRGTSKATISAAKNGKLETLRYIHQTDLAPFSKLTMDAACEGGHVEIVKFLHQNRTEFCTIRAIDNCAKNGYIDIIKYIHQNSIELKSTGNAIEYAAALGSIEMLEYLDENNIPMNSPPTHPIVSASFSGHLHMVQYLYNKVWKNQKFHSMLIYEAIIVASGNGHLEIVKYLQQKLFSTSTNINSIPPIAAVFKAGIKGHFEIVKYLLELNVECFSVQIEELVLIVSHADIEISKYIILKKREMVTETIVNVALNSPNPLEMTKFFHELGYRNFSQFSILKAASISLEVFLFFHENGYQIGDEFLIERAVYGGRLDVLKFLKETRSCTPYGQHTIEIAVEKGSLEIVKYLVETLEVPSTQKAIEICCSTHRDMDILKYLLPMKPQFFVHAFTKSCSSGDFDIVRYLVQDFIPNLNYQYKKLMNKKVVSQVIFECALNGHFEILVYLFQNLSLLDGEEQYLQEFLKINLLRPSPPPDDEGTLKNNRKQISQQSSSSSSPMLFPLDQYSVFTLIQDILSDKKKDGFDVIWLLVEQWMKFNNGKFPMLQNVQHLRFLQRSVDKGRIEVIDYLLQRINPSLKLLESLTDLKEYAFENGGPNVYNLINRFLLKWKNLNLDQSKSSSSETVSYLPSNLPTFVKFIE